MARVGLPTLGWPRWGSRGRLGAEMTATARPGTLSSMTLESFTLETFAERVGEAFGVEIEGAAPFDLRLETIREIPAAGWRPDEAAQHRQPFALQFVGPAQFVLPQQIYRFNNSALGVFDMFIVPVGRTADGVSYEAVFT